MILRILLIVVALVVVAALVFLLVNSRWTVESAAYEVVEKDGRFEVRQYPELVLVSTPMTSPNGSFNRLFQYISGGNTGEAKIAMTTPVFMDEQQMSFVMPQDVADQGAPAPSGEKVQLERFPGGRFATLRFSGPQKPENEAEALSQLEGILQQRGLEAAGDPLFAYYDPPWTPPPMRRNEVLVPLRNGR